MTPAHPPGYVDAVAAATTYVRAGDIASVRRIAAAVAADADAMAYAGAVCGASISACSLTAADAPALSAWARGSGIPMAAAATAVLGRVIDAARGAPDAFDDVDAGTLATFLLLAVGMCEALTSQALNDPAPRPGAGAAGRH